ncbi:hypothetical protein F2P45_02405 [Massilia sp. CCM 8733]|uniref:Uncharacterized protein n=1 Tax=Massilia mucilaginosa TaxID=2609282 RepID=A0ABX0NM38_9BURK|nr:hypothetical protein [Massilia mucilaginosa]NHZ87888.1 hypothetical protein [Massilia mucilaginosa]
MSEKLDCLLNKLAIIEREVSAKKGELTFWGLLKRWSPSESWNLIVSSTWSDGDGHPNAIAYIVDKYYAVCDDSERVLIARVVIIDTDDENLEDLLDAYEIEHGLWQVKRGWYFDQEFERGYIFTCKSRNTAAAPTSQAQSNSS